MTVHPYCSKLKTRILDNKVTLKVVAVSKRRRRRTACCRQSSAIFGPFVCSRSCAADNRNKGGRGDPPISRMHCPPALHTITDAGKTEKKNTENRNIHCRQCSRAACIPDDSWLQRESVSVKHPHKFPTFLGMLLHQSTNAPYVFSIVSKHLQSVRTFESVRLSVRPQQQKNTDRA